MDAAAQAAITAAVAEVWTLYAVGTCLIASRLFVRIKLAGFRGLQPDDLLVVFAWMCYTSVSVVSQDFIINAQGKHTSQLSLQDRISLPKSEYAIYEYGSKMFLVGETLYLGTLWALKLCMAFYYRRLMRGLWSETLIIPLLFGIGVTGLAGILTIYTTCTPISKHWQILPNPGPLCVPQNPWTFITIMGLNLATDVCLLSLPITALARMRTNTLRIIGLVFLFSLGTFAMAAAILRIISIFVLNRESAGALWSIREDFLAVVVTQAPMVYPLFGRKFWRAAYGSGDGSSKDALSLKRKCSGADAGHGRGGGENHELTFGAQALHRIKRSKDPYGLSQLGITQAGGTESQETMVHSPFELGATAGVAAAANNHNNSSGKHSSSRKISLSLHRGAPETTAPEVNAAVVMVEQTVTTTFTLCPEEQKRRDHEAWLKQTHLPWEKS